MLSKNTRQNVNKPSDGGLGSANFGGMRFRLPHPQSQRSWPSARGRLAAKRAAHRMPTIHARRRAHVGYTERLLVIARYDTERRGAWQAAHMGMRQPRTTVAPSVI